MQFPVISLWQPWASLCFTEAKNYETRSWRFPEKLVGQTVLIHAAKRFDLPPRESVLRHICATEFGSDFANSLPRGMILGSVRLAGCIPTGNNCPSHTEWNTGDWSSGRFAWKLKDKRLFETPIPAVGRQGFWTFDLA